MSRTRLILQNGCYHITARGNYKQNVFKDEKDFEFYISQLKRYKKKHSFLLYSYCLMPNHIHILGQPADPSNLSKFMQGLQRSYTAYFNNKYEKVGHLWQNRFNSKILNKDEYLVNSIIYIEYNPVRANIVNKPQDYKFSSYVERMSGDDTSFKLINKLLF